MQCSKVAESGSTKWYGVPCCRCLPHKSHLAAGACPIKPSRRSTSDCQLDSFAAPVWTGDGVWKWWIGSCTAAVQSVGHGQSTLVAGGCSWAACVRLGCQMFAPMPDGYVASVLAGFSAERTSTWGRLTDACAYRCGRGNALRWQGTHIPNYNLRQ